MIKKENIKIEWWCHSRANTIGDEILKLIKLNKDNLTFEFIIEELTKLKSSRQKSRIFPNISLIRG